MNTYTYDDQTVSDIHKDAYGFRPSPDFFKRWGEMTPDQKQAEWEHLCGVAAQAVEEEWQEQQRAIAQFEQRVEKCIASGASTREVALRWIADSEKRKGDDVFDGDWEYLCYRLNLPYGYFNQPQR